MFGAQQAGAAAAATASSSSSLVVNGDVARLALAGFGAALVIGMMTVIGALVYLLVLRRRAPRPVRRTTTGSMRPVTTHQTGEVRRTQESDKF